MKKAVKICAIALCVGWIVGCTQNKQAVLSSTQEEQDSIIVESVDTLVTKVDQEEDYPTQFDMNMETYNRSMDYYKSVEKEYQKLIGTIQSTRSCLRRKRMCGDSIMMQ